MRYYLLVGGCCLVAAFSFHGLVHREQNMIKISANLSKKVPLPGVDYSSQQFGAAMEI